MARAERYMSNLFAFRSGENLSIQESSAWKILVLFNAWHLFWIPWIGIMPQDAYYHLYAINPSLSYFDHPPGIAWLIRLFQLFLNSHSVIVLKFMDWLVTLGIQFGAYHLFRTFTGRSESIYLTAWLGASPMILLLAFNTTPDVPLLLGWVWALVVMRKAFSENRMVFWVLTGLLAGITFDSKYAGLWILLAMHGALIFSRTYRRLYRSPGPYLATLLALAVMSPVFIWNAEHHFVSFLFQSGERAATIKRLNPALFFGHLGSQLGVASPFLLIPIWIRLYRNLIRWFGRRLEPDTWFQFIFTAPFVLGFGAIALIYWVKINWVMPAYFTGIMMAAPLLTRNLFKGHFYFALVLHLLLTLEFATYLIPVHSDDTWYGWKELATEVHSIEQEYPGTFVFSADGYKTTAVLRFLNRQTYYAENILGRPALHFDYLGEDLNDLVGKDGIFIDSNPGLKDLDSNPVPAVLHKHFKDIDFIRAIDVKRSGQLVRQFRVYLCHDYLGPNPD